jgi:hypothetical protein
MKILTPGQRIADWVSEVVGLEAFDDFFFGGRKNIETRRV